MHYSCYPRLYNYLYTYTLRDIIYIVQPLGNIISNYHGTFIHIYMNSYDSISKIYIWNSFFSSINLAIFFWFSLFSCQQYTKNYFIIYKLDSLFQLISVNFTSCRLPQSNLLQHFIHFSISKIQVKKPQPRLI